jgi:hypothetical protein
MYSEYPLENWKFLKKYRHDFGKLGSVNFLDITDELVDSTCAKNSALCDYLSYGGTRVSQYLSVWKKYPHVENLVRQKHVVLLDDLFKYAGDNEFSPYLFAHDNVLNLKEKKPDRMLGISKLERYSTKYGRTWFDFFKKAKEEYGYVLSEKELATAKEINLFWVPRLCDKVHPAKLIEYLEKQRKITPHLTVRDMVDYYNMVEEYYGELPSSMLLPNNLMKAHDDINERIETRKNEALVAGFKKQFERYKSYTFESDGLVIMPCKKQAELINEGKLLNHCVARYAESHANNKCCIFFIRRAEDLDVPYYTLELIDGKVNQKRGKNNCIATPEINLFVQKWLEKIKTLRRKKSARNRNQTAEPAHA